MPGGWLYVADFGIRKKTIGAGQVGASVGLGQDMLASESGLAEYIEKQKKLIARHLSETKFAGPQTTAFADADEAQLLFVRHNAPSVGKMLHVQTYVRLGVWLGIVTLTTIDTQLIIVRPDYEAFVKGLRISPEAAN